MTATRLQKFRGHGDANFLWILAWTGGLALTIPHDGGTTASAMHRGPCVSILVCRGACLNLSPDALRSLQTETEVNSTAGSLVFTLTSKIATIGSW